MPGYEPAPHASGPAEKAPAPSRASPWLVLLAGLRPLQGSPVGFVRVGRPGGEHGRWTRVSAGRAVSRRCTGALAVGLVDRCPTRLFQRAGRKRRSPDRGNRVRASRRVSVRYRTFDRAQEAVTQRGEMYAKPPFPSRILAKRPAGAERRFAGPISARERNELLYRYFRPSTPKFAPFSKTCQGGQKRCCVKVS